MRRLAHLFSRLPILHTVLVDRAKEKDDEKEQKKHINIRTTLVQNIYPTRPGNALDRLINLKLVLNVSEMRAGGDIFTDPLNVVVAAWAQYRDWKAHCEGGRLSCGLLGGFGKLK